MKLSEKSIEQFKTIIDLCNIIKTDVMTIKDGKLSAIDEAKSVVLMSDDNIPDFAGLEAGFNRLPILAKHFKAFKDQELIIDVKESDNDKTKGQVQELNIKGKNTSSKYKCANVLKCRTPAKLHDEIVWVIEIPYEETQNILSAYATMGTDNTLITARNGEMFVEFVDLDSSDSFTIKISSELFWVPEDTECPSKSFSYKYLSQSLIPLIKHSVKQKGDLSITIGAKGMLQFTIQGYTFTLLNRKGQ